MHSPTPRPIEDIKKCMEEKFELTGFPTEEQVSLMLLNKGWTVYRNVKYRDKTERKFKEIDITAIKGFKTNMGNTQIVLVIECKKEEKCPWVFFKGTEKVTDPLTINFVSKEKYMDYAYKLIERNFKGHYYFNEVPATFTFSPYRIFDVETRKNDDRDPIETAINQTLTNFTEIFAGESELVQKSNLELVFIYPILVFNGDLISYSMKKEAVREDRLVYLTNINAGADVSIAGNFHRVKPVAIDVVNFSHFSDFIDLIEKKGLPV